MRREAAVVLALVGVLVTSPQSQTIPQNTGAASAWEKILKLRTTASVMHITAHPDDEHGGVLAKLSRGDGARVSLLTLNRGESGDNAIGPQLFDALRLIRTEELLQAGRYYGILLRSQILERCLTLSDSSPSGSRSRRAARSGPA